MTKIVNRSLISLALLLCTFASIGQPKYYDYAGKFKVQFPGKPATDSQVQETDIGNVTLYQFIYETQDYVYMVSYVDYPADKLNPDKKELLKNAKDGFVNALNLTVSEEGFITYGKHQGIRFVANDSEKYCIMRDYLVDNRLYQLGILQFGKISEQAENDFFDSFELVK